MSDRAYHLGIDLGTTFTACGLARDGRAEVVTLGVRTAAVPTVAHRLAGGAFLGGEAAENRAVSEPARVAREFKRRLGDPTPLLLGGQPVDPTRLYAEVLGWVVDHARTTEGQGPELVAVTHPAT
ncbi:MAG: Hsp70 family protein [Acidimicrobiia bacterium]|nr:Hsp70 family protein [Acidimicrobiia bacterium]